MIDVTPYATDSASFSPLRPAVACWGDSLTQGTGATAGHDWPADFADVTGRSVYNGGVFGETSTQIAGRMLADAARHPLPTVIWAGRNDFAGASTVLANVAAMVAALGHRRYLILGVINNHTEVSGSTAYNQIVALNAALAAAYGPRYVDVRAALVAAYDSTVAADVTDHGNDCPPASLRSDVLHLNDAGYALVASLVAAKSSVLDGTAAPLPGSGLAGLMRRIGRFLPFLDGRLYLPGNGNNSKFGWLAWNGSNAELGPSYPTGSDLEVRGANLTPGASTTASLGTVDHPWPALFVGPAGVNSAGPLYGSVVVGVGPTTTYLPFADGHFYFRDVVHADSGLTVTAGAGVAGGLTVTGGAGVAGGLSTDKLIFAYYSVSSLPAAGGNFTVALASDLSVTTPGAVAVGGGSNARLVLWNGANWLVV